MPVRPSNPDYLSGGLFGRRIGKPLSPLQTSEYDQGLAKFGIPTDAALFKDIHELFETPVTHFHLEIGFGSGESLLASAKRETVTGFFGVEPFINGMAKVCGAVKTENLTNIRLFHQDAVLLLDKLPDASLDGIDLFYPDPWHKKRHWKRRFVSPENLDRFARILKSGGKFRFASDIAHYVNWTLAALDKHPAFDWIANSPGDWQQPYPFWPGSRYEQKAKREGRTPTYLTFLRS